MRKTPTDLESLEEEKINSDIGNYSRNRNRYSSESDTGARNNPNSSQISDYQDLSIGEAQKHREGRDSFYTFPIYHNENLLVHRRYREFV